MSNHSEVVVIKDRLVTLAAKIIPALIRTIYKKWYTRRELQTLVTLPLR